MTISEKHLIIISKEKLLRQIQKAYEKGVQDGLKVKEKNIKNINKATFNINGEEVYFRSTAMENKE